MVNSRFYVSEISPHFNLQFLHEIKVKFIDFWFRGFVFKPSFIKYHFTLFLSSIHHPIWSNSKRSSRISLIPYGFDPYLPLYPSIRELFWKLVSLDFILTWDCVFSTTSRSRSVKRKQQTWFHLNMKIFNSSLHGKNMRGKKLTRENNPKTGRVPIARARFLFVLPLDGW